MKISNVKEKYVNIGLIVRKNTLSNKLPKGIQL